jgi:hypothetical protein
VRLPRGLFGETELDLNVSLIAEVNQFVDYAAVVTIEIRFAGHAGNMRGEAVLRHSSRGAPSCSASRRR